MAELLTDQAIEERLKDSGWSREHDSIVRDWKFENFVEAIGFVNRVADVAEEANHHPDITVHGWNNVRLTLSTHSAGGLTTSDFDVAARLDELA